jgi:hypothetical protein
MREKLASFADQEEVFYIDDHWNLFKKLRDITYNILDQLKSLYPIVHGSIARGDIHEKSDIDVAFLKPLSEFKIISNLNGDLNGDPMERWIIQATPLSAIKGVLVFDQYNISFPLIPLYPQEEEFYKFGGSLTFNDIGDEKYKRIPGVNKKLLFIQPTEQGHIETRISPKNAGRFAKILNIKMDTILERMRVLERRNKVGRTGVFLKRILMPEESFGEVLSQIERSNPATRRRIQRKKI